MDQANNTVLPGTVSVSLEEEKKEHYLPGVGESSSIHEPDQQAQNQDPVSGRTATDGADRPHQCSEDDRRDECPICNERFGASGDRRVVLLHCDHALCHHCLSRILRRARDPSRVQCPFCRQNTPLSCRDFVQMMLEEACDGNGSEAPAPGACSSYSSAPLLADVQLADPHAAPQAPLGCLFAPESEQLDGWAGGGGGGGVACGSWICPASVLEALSVMTRPSCCLPSTTVLLVLLLLLPWFFMSLRYL